MAQLPAGHKGIVLVEPIVADSRPRAIVSHFQPAFVGALAFNLQRKLNGKVRAHRANIHVHCCRCIGNYFQGAAG